MVQDTDVSKEVPASFLHDFHGVLEYEFQMMKLEVFGSPCRCPISFVQQQYIPPYLTTSIELSAQEFVGINNSKLVILGKLFCKVKINGNYVNLCTK